MKKTHIIFLVAIAALIVGLLTLATSDLSTYDSISSAKQKKGQFVHMIAKLDKSQPVEYDPIKNPNYLAFYATDSLGDKVKVVYANSKPTELEKSERVVLKGKMTDAHFECKEILLKCPSKYKEDKKELEKTVSQNG